MKPTVLNNHELNESKATPPIDTGAAAPSPQEFQTSRRGRKPRAAPAAPLQETAVGAEPVDAAQEPKTRRPRKPAVDAVALAKQLKGIHALAAKLVPIPGPDGTKLLELSDVEASELASAVAAVAKEYDLELSGKTGAAIQLLSVAAMIYVPRLYIIQQMRMFVQRQHAMAEEAARKQDASVVADVHVNGGASAAAN